MRADHRRPRQPIAGSLTAPDFNTGRAAVGYVAWLRDGACRASAVQKNSRLGRSWATALMISLAVFSVSAASAALVISVG
jgi:hypothetical protein